MAKEIEKAMWNAVKKGEIDNVKNLLKQNEGLLENVTALGSWLHVAASYEQIEVVEYLISEGIDLNIEGAAGKVTPIRCAALQGNLNIVKILYDNGAILDVSTANKNPLFAAIYNNHFKIVKFLVENGIDLTASYSIGQLDRVDACEYARQFGRTEIYNYLKEKMQ